ncbi:carbohydrate-binding module family 14 protein [Nocardia sp. NPDC051321]|uniref:carbohydrate-binding module family 14 protein n=1 Tax=Nocardia sp. NPDC051321 TaxID=3364323 RepID=UPI00378B88FE
MDFEGWEWGDYGHPYAADQYVTVGPDGAHERPCPDGMEWDPKLRHCEYPDAG